MTEGHWQGHVHRIRGENFCNALVFVPAGSHSHGGSYYCFSGLDSNRVSAGLDKGYAGDGSTDHLDEDVPPPKEIHLSDGQYELGREEPAQIVIPYPTVSSRHAMLRVGASSSCSRAPVVLLLHSALMQIVPQTGERSV